MALYARNLSIYPYSVTNNISFTQIYVSANAEIVGYVPPSSNYYYYYSALIIDGVVGDVGQNSIYRPSETRNNVNARGYIKDTAKSVAIRLWETDPRTNADAEYIDSPVVDFINMYTLTDGPEFECDIQIDIENADKIHVNATSYKDFVKEHIKVYSIDPPLVLIDSAVSDDGTYSITTPTVTLQELYIDVTSKDSVSNKTYKSTSLISVMPRFYVEDDYSKLTDYFPLITSKGKRVTKLPFISETNTNIYLSLSAMKSAVTGYNMLETNPNRLFKDKSQNSYLSTEYINERTGKNVDSLSSSLDVGYQIDAGSKSTRFYLSDLNAGSIDRPADIKQGDIISPKIEYEDGTILDKPKLTATLCSFNRLPSADFKFKSAPPIDFKKPTYTVEFENDGIDEYVFFANIGASQGDLVFVDNEKCVVRLSTRNFSFGSDMLYITEPAKWYPNTNIIESYNDSSGSHQLSFKPLITTGKEVCKLAESGAQVAGSVYELQCTLENFIDMNIGVHTYVWKKDGVVLPTEKSRYIHFDALSPDNNGSYVLEYTASPIGIKAPDSDIKLTSAPFVINVDSTNDLLFTFDASNKTLDIGAELKIDGVISIDVNTISKSQLWKNDAVVKTFANTDLNLEYVVASATEDDAGVYQFRITYMDGPVERNFTSESKHVTIDTNPHIDFTVTTSAVPTDEGDRAVIVGTVTSITPPSGVTYVYQWHKESIGAIVGANDKDLVIDAVTAADDDKYWLSVLAQAPNYSATLKASARSELIVRVDPQLRFSIAAESNTVADGKPAKLSMSFSANTNVSPTWDWYANGEKIANSTDKATLEHTAYGDVIYYIQGKPKDTHFIQTVVQSNMINVHGVVAVEDLTLTINGPITAGLGDRVLFEANIAETNHVEGSNPISKDNYSYEWYRGTTKIGTGKEIRIYAASDAGGDYTYKIFSKVDPTITKTSPIHKFTIKEDQTVSVTLPPTKSVKVGEVLTITPTITPAEDVDTKFQWMKNGNAITGKTEKVLTIDAVTKADTGVYTLSVTNQSTPTISTPCVVTVRDDVIPPDPEPVTGEWYIHDLRPGRNRGFTWMGWWVLDEIQKAINDDFDWLADPTNPRFKYQNVLKALADNKDTWDDIEIQESRNGYILLLSELK